MCAVGDNGEKNKKEKHAGSTCTAMNVMEPFNIC
jgi:hypothetical protein